MAYQPSYQPYGAPGYPPQGAAPVPYGAPPGGPYGAPPPGPYAPPPVNAPPAGVYAPPNDLSNWFRAVDRDGSGRIDLSELNSALSSAGFQFSIGTTEKLLMMFDNDRSGHITYDEFVQLHQFISQMQNGFQQRDTSRDGRLDSNEIRAALAASGFTLAEDTFQALMRRFDRQRRGNLGFDDYVELSVFLSKARNSFAYYDRQRTGQVTFTFDTFVGAGVSMT